MRARTRARAKSVRRGNPQLARAIRVRSKRSRLQETDDGEIYEEFSFAEALPHHARYVEKVFRSLDHIYETRSDNGLKEWIQGFNRRATLPHYQTCMNLLEVGVPLPPPASHPPRAPVTDAPPCWPRFMRSSWTRRCSI